LNHNRSTTFIGTDIDGAVTGNAVYNGDGQRVWVSVGPVVTTYIGNYYEYSSNTGLGKNYYR
jgi:uncharacterized protein YcfJ